MYLLRLDDASDHMHLEKWSKLQKILDKNRIKPLVGIIPSNKDPMLCEAFTENPDFWDLAKQWQASGWRIALHGYEHVYSTSSGGMNPIHNKSEFAGHTLQTQRQKIKNGLALLCEKGLKPTVFFAPSHTFDKNTLEALRLESNIRIISDTAANNIYSEDGFTFIPQQTGRPRKLPFRFTTICLHPNFMTETEFAELEQFINTNRKGFIDPNSITETKRKKSILDTIVAKMYFLKRSLRKH